MAKKPKRPGNTIDTADLANLSPAARAQVMAQMGAAEAMTEAAESIEEATEEQKKVVKEQKEVVEEQKKSFKDMAIEYNANQFAKNNPTLYKLLEVVLGNKEKDDPKADEKVADKGLATQHAAETADATKGMAEKVDITNAKLDNMVALQETANKHLSDISKFMQNMKPENGGGGGFSLPDISLSRGAAASKVAGAAVEGVSNASKVAGAAGNAAQGVSKWSKFLTFLEKTAPALFRRFMARAGSALAGLAIPGPGWIWTAVSVLGSLSLAYEIYEMWKEFSGGGEEKDQEKKSSPEKSSDEFDPDTGKKLSQKEIEEKNKGGAPVYTAMGDFTGTYEAPPEAKPLDQRQAGRNNLSDKRDLSGTSEYNGDMGAAKTKLWQAMGNKGEAPGLHTMDAAGNKNASKASQEDWNRADKEDEDDERRARGELFINGKWTTKEEQQKLKGGAPVTPNPIATGAAIGMSEPDAEPVSKTGPVPESEYKGDIGAAKTKMWQAMGNKGEAPGLHSGGAPSTQASSAVIDIEQKTAAAQEQKDAKAVEANSNTIYYLKELKFKADKISFEGPVEVNGDFVIGGAKAKQGGAPSAAPSGVTNTTGETTPSGGGGGGAPVSTAPMSPAAAVAAGVPGAGSDAGNLGGGAPSASTMQGAAPANVGARAAGGPLGTGAAPAGPATPPPAGGNYGDAIKGTGDSGLLPDSALAPIGQGSHRAQPAAAAAFKAMRDAAKADGVDLSVTDSYRSYAAQVAVKKAKPNLAATPGKSNHGWGLAFDMGFGSNRNSPGFKWMQANASKYGFSGPLPKPDEPWHWTYTGGKSDPSAGAVGGAGGPAMAQAKDPVTAVAGEAPPSGGGGGGAGMGGARGAGGPLGMVGGMLGGRLGAAAGAMLGGLMQPSMPTKGSELASASGSDAIDQRTAKQSITVNSGTSEPPPGAVKSNDSQYSAGNAGNVEPVDAKKRFAELFGMKS